MRKVADEDRIRRFMRALGGEADVPACVYFTGGATAVLLGWRATTIDVDIRVILESDRLYRAIPSLKESLHLGDRTSALSLPRYRPTELSGALSREFLSRGRRPKPLRCSAATPISAATGKERAGIGVVTMGRAAVGRLDSTRARSLPLAALTALSPRRHLPNSGDTVSRELGLPSGLLVLRRMGLGAQPRTDLRVFGNLLLESPK